MGVLLPMRRRKLARLEQHSSEAQERALGEPWVDDNVKGSKISVYSVCLEQGGNAS